MAKYNITYRNYKYYPNATITSKVDYFETNDLVLTGVEFEPNFCFMHQLTYTSYGSKKNFDIYSPGGHYQYISDTTLTINRTYDANDKTYTLSFSSDSPNNRWTGTWEILLAQIEN